MEPDLLRPLERTVVRLADTGMSRTEIAWRFRRSPGHIGRVLEWSRLPRQRMEASPAGPMQLRAIERRVLRARTDGIDVAETAARMRRSPEHVSRVDQYATYKLAQGATL